jgi:glycosyltransferase involved in cell wall biosynthesis
VQLHRWCQWISAHHTGGVYDGELFKHDDYAASLPAYLLPSLLADVAAGRPVTILAEEWHTAAAVLKLDALLRANGARHRVRILWNANNTFGFDRVDWAKLAQAATITTVSRYMKHAMHALGVDALVIPNGLEPTAYAPLDATARRTFRARAAQRLVLAKLARFDPDKRWLGAIDTLAALKQRRLRPLLIARGGIESHGHEVLERARQHGLVVSERSAQPGTAGMNDLLQAIDDVDIIHLTSHVGPEARRMLFRGAAGVLANSSHEPFGLVGLEAMAAGGVACTGISGEDYAVPGHNAIVLQTGATEEAVAHLERLRANPMHERALRREGVATARKYSWASVLERNLIPQLEMMAL